MLITNPPTGGSGNRKKDKARRPGEEHSVRILSDRFQPPYVRVKQGDKVCWSLEMAGRPSNVKAMHVVSFLQLGEESDLLKSDSDKFEMTFEQLGTFEYRCGIRARMTGIIEVLEAESGSDTAYKPIKITREEPTRIQAGSQDDEDQEELDSDEEEEQEFMSRSRASIKSPK